METKIKVAVSTTQINRIEKVVDLPEISKYYSNKAEHLTDKKLFAIILKYPDAAQHRSFLVISIKRGKQDYNDFIPHDDCNSDYFITGCQLRRKAFDIICDDTLHCFEEITESEFETERKKLLDVHKGD